MSLSWLCDEFLQVDSSSVSVLYENGDSEELATSEVLRDRLLSLGWISPLCARPAESDPCASSEAASAAGEV